jgi:hypothetical protein
MRPITTTVKFVPPCMNWNTRFTSLLAAVMNSSLVIEA